jgi:endonuclease IV
MIHIYSEIADALKAVEALRWIDIAPRDEENINIYPAAYIDVEEQAPLNLLGGLNGMAEVIFSVEIWLKPYHSTAIKPLSPALDDLKNNFQLVAEIRSAIMSVETGHLWATTLKSETIEKQPSGFYSVLQRWEAMTSMWDDEPQPLPEDTPAPVLVMEEG